MPTQERLNHVFEYRSGELYWKNPPKKGPRKVGDIAGGIQENSPGYFRKITRVDYRPILVHRAIWIMHHGEIPDGMIVDHINRDPLDNRIENLRLATHAENAANSKVSKSNSTGHRYISKNTRSGRKPFKVSFVREFACLNEAIEFRDKLIAAVHDPDIPLK